MSESRVDHRYMEFRVGKQYFALPLLTVKEVISRPETTFVPNMPAFFEGMINLRGQILGIYSVRKKLGAVEKNSAQSKDVVIIIEHSGVNVGMVVDEVTRVLHADEKSICAAPVKDDDPASRFIGSVIQTESELVMTVHVAELLELEKLTQHIKSA